MQEYGLDERKVSGSGKGGRILKEDVQKQIDATEAAAVTPAPKPKTKPAPSAPAPSMPAGDRPEKRVPMTRLRKRIAERLVEAQHTAAILTTFNEVNMQPVMELRARHRERFEKEHGVRLGFMSFFVKATVEALRHFPEVNASIDGDEVAYHGFYDIGIAVSSPRGLVVPVLRDADRLTMAEIETCIRDFGERAQNAQLTLEEITGGTFTITNGGVFGSLMSTPILNPPQSAILGMHKIQDRPVAENGQVVIRPMMYLALSYDHRLVDGREAVQFLVMIKELLEDPARLLLEV
jgi:2-oxoglutarate dehydrogenase E2 component (dihydrolipoamide succinyltransferase)